MMLRSAHHAGVMPSVSLTWRNSIRIVLASSSGTIQRLIIGPLNGCSMWPSAGFSEATDQFTREMVGTDGSQTLPWREMDSNFRFLVARP
jgi:hypothetical protein